MYASPSSVAANGGAPVLSAASVSPDPSCWSGPALAASQHTWRHALTDDELAALSHAADEAASLPSLLDVPTQHSLPPPLPDLGRRLRDALFRGHGLFVLSGVPVAAWGERKSASAFWLLGSMIGVAVPQNAAGHCLGHVKDAGNDASRPGTRLYTTAAAQPFHTDSADVVGLLCLKTAAFGGASQVVSSVAVHAALEAAAPRHAATLRRPFVFDRKGEVPAGKAPTYSAPVFTVMPPSCSGGPRRVVSAYDRSFIAAAQAAGHVPPPPPLSEEQVSALDAADAAAASDELRLDMDLSVGDIQFLHSHTTWHARSAFHDGGNGGGARSARHLLRLWLTPAAGDAWELPPCFEERFGTVEVDGPTPRGGLRVPGAVLCAPLQP